MSDILEGRYRRLLRWYPREYRERREAEMLSTFLDAAPANRVRPPIRDVGDIIVHGAARRFSLTPGQFAADILVDAGPVALGMAAGFSAIAMAAELWWSAFPWETVGPFFSLGPAVYLVALLSFAMLIAGAARSARIIAAVGAIATLGLVPVAPFLGFNRPPLHILVMLFLLLAVVSIAPVRTTVRITTRTAMRTRLLAILGLIAGAGWTLAAWFLPARQFGSGACFYRCWGSGLASANSWLPWWLMGIVAAAIAIATLMRRPQLVVVAVLVTTPWSLMPVNFDEQVSLGNIAPALGLAGWMFPAGVALAVTFGVLFERQRRRRTLSRRALSRVP